MGRGAGGSRKQGGGGESGTCGCCQPSPEEIARHACELWLARGATHGHDIDDWLEAECELRRARRRERHGAAA